jgi:hypothetical protein
MTASFRMRAGALALVVAAGAAAGTLLGGAVPATAAGTTDTTPKCPSSNPPNTLVVVSGTPQTAKLGSSFASGLQVELSNTNGCPVTTPLATIAITFTAPATGPSATFEASGSNAVTVGTDATGTAAAQPPVADSTPGSFTIVASSAYGSVSFWLTNTAASVPATIAPATAAPQTATVGTAFEQPLQARVVDAAGNPVQGAAVTFSLAAGSAGAGGSFLGGGAQAAVTTDATGLATSPPLTANDVAGSFTATASAGTPLPASFTLRNLAAAPASVTPGVAAVQSARTRTRFPIRLAVTVADADHNPVPGVLVRFAAPSRGPSGTFAPARGRRARSRTVAVRTDTDGIAVAPAFVANARAGGYVVKATAAGAPRPAAFALVNEKHTR